MYKFNNSNLITFYIKQLLKDFNLPVCPVWKSGMKSYKGAFYIHNNIISRCLNTGDWEEFTTENFKTVYDNYSWGKYYNNLTKNLVVKNFIYDSYTHNYLGEYLRFLRDYRGVDLMSLYNCFSNQEISSLTIKDSNQELFSNKDGSKIYMINIKPFSEYTIFIDSTEKVEFVSGYYDNGLINPFEGLDDVSSSYVFPYSATYFSASNLSFNKPIIYDKMSKENMTADVWANIVSPITFNQRQNLKLFIKVPSTTNVSSLVILEGRYLDNVNLHFDENSDLKLPDIITSIPFNEEGEPLSIYDVDQSENRKMISKLSLIKLQSHIQHPFSDRLIEYLTSNAIKPYDPIDNNISRVQDILTQGIKVKVPVNDTFNDVKIKLNKRKMDGEWDKAMTNTIWGLARVKDLVNSKYDILGYVDKDIEQAIVLEDI